MTQQLLNQLSEVLDLHIRKGLIGIKSELESEGIRLNELTTLNILSKSKGLKTALKIGGAEAKSDIIVAFEQLTDYVISPMIESSYAARKYVDMYSSMCTIASYKPPLLLLNIETVTALSNLREIIDVSKDVISGIVFGRVDFTLSSGLARSNILSDFVCESAHHVSTACRDDDLEFVLGGGVSVESVDFLKRLFDIRLDRYETRKCVLSGDSLFNSDVNSLLQDCVLAELLWLKYKSSCYNTISLEDARRIEMLEARHLYNLSSCR